jgi:hypothetical protein
MQLAVTAGGSPVTFFSYRCHVFPYRDTGHQIAVTFSRKPNPHTEKRDTGVLGYTEKCDTKHLRPDSRPAASSSPTADQLRPRPGASRPSQSPLC